MVNGEWKNGAALFSLFTNHQSPITLPAMLSPTTRIFLVRHGATVLTAEDRFAGATDVPLSALMRARACSWFRIRPRYGYCSARCLGSMRVAIATISIKGRAR